MDKGKLGLSIVICTRNRPLDLARCVGSLCCQAEIADVSGVELVVVDDGALEAGQIDHLTSMLPEWIAWRYQRKAVSGFFRSLQVAVQIVRYPVVLFLDDDVELEPGYLGNLMEHYRREPELAGLGGVDRLQRSSWLWRCYTRLFLYSSGRPGKLSYTGYGGSLPLWNAAVAPFASEFLYGCNMSFRCEALRLLPDCEWMNGYSLVADLLVTRIAAQQGMVWVDPALGVLHHQSPASRDSAERVAQMQIVHHAYLFQQFGATRWQRLWFYWTWLGLYLLTLRQGDAGKACRNGYLSGIRQVRELWR